jgi:hypothetical protein
VPGLEAMRWMDEPPAAEPHARPTSTSSQRQQKPVDIAFLVTPPTLNLLRCLQPECVFALLCVRHTRCVRVRWRVCVC